MTEKKKILVEVVFMTFHKITGIKECNVENFQKGKTFTFVKKYSRMNQVKFVEDSL